MKREVAALVAGVAAAGLFASSSIAEQVAASAHKIILPEEIAWGPAPASLPAGAQAALLYGDPSKPGVFALRVKIPKDYFIPPHTHPQAEVVTILSGKFALGTGEKADRASTKAIGAGGFMAMPPKAPHYVFAEEETILQITSNGPWAIDYIDPKDDPRLNVAPARPQGS